MQATTTDNQTQDQEVPQSQEGGSPLDDTIAKVKEYIKDPKLITPQTMGDLLSELEDLKSYLDEEENQSGEPQDAGGPSDQSGGGLTIAIGKAMKGR